MGFARASLGQRVTSKLCQIGSLGVCEMKQERHFINHAVSQHLILGTDGQDAEKQRDLWLSQNPAIKVVRIHDVRQEPATLLTRIGRKRVPRVSIMVEYEQPDARAE
jgi:hypothetical protein